MSELDTAVRLGVAALAGMAVGVEREWSGHASGPGARFAGVRTFFLMGALGGLGGWLLETADPVVAGVLLLGGAGLIVAAYLTAARRSADAIDGTTEAAALVVLGIGVLAGLGLLAVASGAAAVVVLILGEKSYIHGFLDRIVPAERQAALQFAVLALVILPLLPAGPIESLGGIKPRGLWTVVLIFCGINFASYIARRVLGDSRGYPVMGALGGLLSSTAVTLNFSRLSRREPSRSDALAVGTVAACTILALRILVVIAVLNRVLLAPAALALAPVFLVGAALVLFRLLRPGKGGDSGAVEHPDNPLRLLSAIQMTVAFQIVLSLLGTISARFGQNGVLASAALLGLTDMDALTFGMSRLADTPGLVVLAARAIALGVTVNSVVKMTLALVLGSGEYRRKAAPGLGLLAVAGALGFWLVGTLPAPP